MENLKHFLINKPPLTCLWYQCIKYKTEYKHILCALQQKYFLIVLKPLPFVRAHFFAIYDGHGGSLCCDFLKDNLHEFLINSPSFPSDPKKALLEAVFKS